MDFRISGLDAAPFSHYIGLDDDSLAALGARRIIADGTPYFPCRVTLEDAPAGEALILLHWQHLDVDTPYRAGGPIFVREAARTRFEAVNHVPLQQRRRTLSVRAYDAAGWMRDGRVMEGEALAQNIGKFFADPEVAYLHVHNAGRGCYSCRVDRA